MRILALLSLLFLVSCKGSEGGSKGIPLNPEIYESVWRRGYTEGGTSYEEYVAVVETTAVIQIRLSNGALINSLTWRLTPLSATTVRVNDGTETFLADYEITGNQLELCREGFACLVYQR